MKLRPLHFAGLAGLLCACVVPGSASAVVLTHGVASGDVTDNAGDPLDSGGQHGVDQARCLARSLVR
jgi:hypothetical protein